MGPQTFWSLWVRIGEFTFFRFFDDLVMFVNLMPDFQKQLGIASTVTRP
jgi:hypothetical protein